MMKIQQEIVRFVREEEGAGIIEYSLIAGIMAAIIIAVLYTTIGKDIGGLFTKIASDLTKATTGPKA